MDVFESWYGKTLKGNGVFDYEGHRIGDWYFYDEHNTLCLEGYYVKGDKQGEWFEYSSINDNKISTVTHYNYGKKHGTYKALFYDGSIQITGTFIDDEPHGEWVEYTKEGLVYRTEQYLNGVKHGAFEFFLKGESIWVNNYKHGSPIGEYRYFRYDQIVIQGRHVNGLKFGQWNYFYESGELGAYGNYVIDKMHGEWIFLNRSQQEEGRALFDNGVLISRVGEYCENEDQILDFCETKYI